MEKLELKHLAPYLPYGLNVEHFDNGFLFRQQMVANISKSELGNIINIDSVDGDKYKPILRPLSYLTKAQTEQLAELLQITRPYLKSMINKHIRGHRFSNLSYKYTLILFENHYDVFGLIDAGQAIDVNTI